MVVTDLHGDWDAYRRYRNRFVDLQAKDRADCLIFTGDLIHAEDPQADGSIEIVLDVLKLRQTYGPAIIYLCGNHELPHIYSISLAKGERVYTPDFEKALNNSGRRAEIIDLFRTLPFYLRTQSGLALAHAGAPAQIAAADTPLKLFNWSHRSLLSWADTVIGSENIEALRQGYANANKGIPYKVLAKYFLDVSSPTDPRYDDLLRGFIATSAPLFEELLWPALFTRCEEWYGLADYRIFLEALLTELSRDFTPQKLLVAGHMPLKGGHKIVAGRHLRIASSRHATPRQAGQYLLFDTAAPLENIKDLTQQLGSVFA